ncbi:hypothetical protein ACROYT_G026492, partial [Oculina patagonica]
MSNAKQKVDNAVCLIRGETYDEENKLVGYKGTGFHYGNGWIMTVAHNFQDDNEKNEKTHSILSDARFEVEFDIEGQKYTFEKQKRMAFVHHLQPGDDPDYKNKDIAMVKLGKQWEYGRPTEDFSEWEIEEDNKLFKQMKADQFSLAEIGPPTPNKGEPVYTAHYGGDDNEKKYEEGTSKILDIKGPTDHLVPMLHLEKKRGVMPEGASGCPIMIEREGKYRLVGLHFSGDEDDKD